MFLIKLILIILIKCIIKYDNISNVVYLNNLKKLGKQLLLNFIIFLNRNST